MLEPFVPRRIAVPYFRINSALVPRWPSRRIAASPCRYRARALRLTREQESGIRALAGTKSLRSLAGGINLFGEAGKHSPWMTWPELVASDPDIIVIMPCGFDIARSQDEVPALTQRAGWSTLSAVQAGRVYLTDGNQYFNRPGPRLGESLEILAELLHPETFRFGHEGTGWERAAEVATTTRT